ncbi:MAG: hypothetical protein AAGB00_09705 [Planctomycetota bacterium]
MKVCCPRTASIHFAAILAMVSSSLSLAADDRGVAPNVSASPHPVVAALIEGGFPVAEGVKTPLSPPLLSPRMTGDEQQAAIQTVVSGALYDRFVRERVTARQEFEVSTAGELPDGGKVRRLDQYFIVHGSLALIRDEQLMDGFMAQEKKHADADARGLSQYLEPLDPTAGKPEDGEPYVYRYRYPLLNKVVISGLIRGQSYSGENVLIESAVSAEDLLADADNPTVWRDIPRRAESDAQLGPPTTFRGVAGYLQVTDLDFLPGAVLVEVHGLLVEPYDWYRGKNLLGSKLSFVAEENVEKLRRKVKKLKAAEAAQ